jgi:hypothetical protein
MGQNESTMRFFEFRNANLTLGDVFYFLKMIVEVHNDGLVYIERLDISQQEAIH